MAMIRVGLRRGLIACVLVALAALLSLAPYLRDSAELVRMRNALLMDAGPTTSFDWTPASMPADFAVERALPEPRFSARVQALRLEQLPNDWERALALGRHLLENRHKEMGTPIQSDLEQTYRVIRDTGKGYCGDYADVYTALALAAGLQVRSWAFSFDGFGGWGHIFNEVWDAQAGRWRMIDVFNNLYFVGADGAAMSALELHAALRQPGSALRLQPVEASALPGFKFEDKAREYFRRGANEWYLWWGNAVYSYDRAPLVRIAGGLSRSLEQLGGIAQGVHPRIRVLDDAGNERQRAAMQRLRLHVLAVLGIEMLALVGALALLLAARRARRAALHPASA